MAPSGRDFGAVIGRVKNNRVVGDAKIIQLLEELANHAVVLHHPVGMDAFASLSKRLRF